MKVIIISSVVLLILIVALVYEMGFFEEIEHQPLARFTASPTPIPTPTPTLTPYPVIYTPIPTLTPVPTFPVSPPVPKRVYEDKPPYYEID